MEIKAVILDFGGTLADGGLDWDPYHETIRSYLASHGYFVQMNVMKKALRGALAELNRFRAKGKEIDEVRTKKGEPYKKQKRLESMVFWIDFPLNIMAEPVLRLGAS